MLKIDFKALFRGFIDKCILHMGDPYKCRYNGDNGAECRCDECEFGLQCYQIQKERGDLD
jgi:hypothetical protein